MELTVRLKKDTIDILESLRQHPRESKDDLVKKALELARLGVKKTK